MLIARIYFIIIFGEKKARKSVTKDILPFLILSYLEVSYNLDLIDT